LPSSAHAFASAACLAPWPPRAAPLLCVTSFFFAFHCITALFPLLASIRPLSLFSTFDIHSHFRRPIYPLVKLWSSSLRLDLLSPTLT
jgi:hypothetical protein